MARLKLFLDTNVIIDLLADRQPFSNSAYLIFKEAKLKRWNLYASTNSILTTYYILQQQLKAKTATRAIENVIKRLEIQDLTKRELVAALASKTEDLEDASQIECANKVGNISFIVTRDSTGFKNSMIDVIHPDELIQVFVK